MCCSVIKYLIDVYHMPSMHRLGIPFYFIVSANPLVFGFNGFPEIGLDTALNDKEAIQKVAERMAEFQVKRFKMVASNFELAGAKLPQDVPITFPLNPKAASIYTYPLEGETV